ncbi:hypothetical protein [Metabacillus sp. B2-18]|uniref:magnesium chelatase subunit ChlI family protein n=1 Tax=Metabacillus sp. B2-18 TaxID=2897333 RepID=UPI002F2B53F9
MKIIRLARTIADIKGEVLISDEDLKEAMLLRKLAPPYSFFLDRRSDETIISIINFKCH